MALIIFPCPPPPFPGPHLPFHGPPYLSMASGPFLDSLYSFLAFPTSAWTETVFVAGGNKGERKAEGFEGKPPRKQEREEDFKEDEVYLDLFYINVDFLLAIFFFFLL